MAPRRELAWFATALAALLAAFFGECLVGGKILSPADVLRASVTFGGPDGPAYEPANRLLIDPVLQFQPWLAFNRAMLRQGRLPLWNDRAGCGAPHLANGQSAVFDPFHLVAYLGRLPDAYAWMACARLWVAGLGMFLLARAWGLGGWGRWFAGLAFPFCGFLVVWLQYPVTSVAVWLPWLLLASDRMLARPTAGRFGGLGLCVGLVLLGGHVQTSAHVLLAAGLYVLWRWRARRRAVVKRREACPDEAPGEEAEAGLEPVTTSAVAGWAGGVLLGVVLGAVAIVPLGFYLTRSPVWADRAQAKVPAWQLRRPRLLDAVCTALPYVYGSQRRGQPNLARALGVHNLNESAGGFAGLATLIWLLPAAWPARGRQPRVRFLAALVAVGALGAFRLPPVDNVLRAVPVLSVTDNRRLTLWVAFGLVLLGGVGLDNLAAVGGRRGWRWWTSAWVVMAVALLASPCALGWLRPRIEAQALAHYARAAAETPGLDPALARLRAGRQVQATVQFVPRYLALSAAQLLALAALAAALRGGRLPPVWARGGVLGLVMADLLLFGHGLNPAIPRADDQPESPVIAYLKRELKPSERVLALGAELPPNALVRFGLADMRNYDSVELERSLAWFAPLYEPGASSAHTSRQPITWAGVLRARQRLEAAGVAAVVSAGPPPPGAFDRVDRLAGVWIARLNAAPRVSAASGRRVIVTTASPGLILCQIPALDNADHIAITETFDPGWRAWVDGRPRAVRPCTGAFLAVEVRPGERTLLLRYDPPEVRAAVWLSLAGLTILLGAIIVDGGKRRKKVVIGLDRFARSGYNRSRDLHRTSQPVSH